MKFKQQASSIKHQASSYRAIKLLSYYALGLFGYLAKWIESCMSLWLYGHLYEAMAKHIQNGNTQGSPAWAGHSLGHEACAMNH